MSARFLFTCWPFEGHVFPQVSIALALRERGHQVAFATPAQARERLEAEGFTVFPFEHVQETQWRRVHRAERETSARRQSVRIQQQALRDWLVGTIPDQLRDLRAAMERFRPDVLVTDIAMWAPIVVLGEATPIPVALSSTFMGPLIPGPDAPAWGFGLAPPRTAAQRAATAVINKATEVLGTPLRRRVDRIRAANGLGPLGCTLNEHSARLPLYLVGNLPELDYDRRDLPASVHYVGACIWHPPEPPGTAEWLAGVPTDRPWVHVTEGTSHYQDHFLLRAAAQGLSGGPWEAVLTTGGQLDPADVGLAERAGNVHTTRWLSHSELLPRCRVVVTTGGPATIMAALRAGVPLVVVPTTWDKPDNARRVVEAGVGVRLRPRRCTPEGLRAAVTRVLEEPSFAARARQVADRLAASPGPRGAAELLEGLAGRVEVPTVEGGGR